MLRGFDDVVWGLIHDEGATGYDGVGWMQDLCADPNVPRLRVYGIERPDLSEVVRHVSYSSSMNGNPVEFSENELLGILQAAL